MPSFPILRAAQPEKLVYPKSIHTNADLLSFYESLLRPQIPKVVYVFLIGTSAQCVLTLIGGTYLLAKKSQQGKLWLFAKRSSAYGTFVIPNSVFVLVMGVVYYLVAWLVFAPSVVYSLWSQHTYGLWLWFIPIPWSALMISSFWSVYSFIMSCSPRSPLSAARITSATTLPSWAFLPVPKTAWLLNTFIFGLAGILFSLVLAAAIAGARYFYPGIAQAKQLFADLQMLTPAELQQEASMDFDWRIRQVWATLSNCFRMTELGLLLEGTVVFTVSAVAWIYAIPITINLVNTASEAYPGKLPDGCSGMWRKIKFLLTEGKPNLKMGDEISKYQNTWKMAIFCCGHIFLLMVAPPVFACTAVFVNQPGWKMVVIEGRPRVLIILAMLWISCITAFFCTYYILFSIIVTFDPFFRAVIGLTLKSAVFKNANLTTGSQLSNGLRPQSDVEMASWSQDTLDIKPTPGKKLEKSVINNVQFAEGEEITITTETVVQVDQTPKSISTSTFSRY